MIFSKGVNCVAALFSFLTNNSFLLRLLILELTLERIGDIRSGVLLVGAYVFILASLRFLGTIWFFNYVSKVFPNVEFFADSRSCSAATISAVVRSVSLIIASVVIKCSISGVTNTILLLRLLYSVSWWDEIGCSFLGVVRLELFKLLPLVTFLLTYIYDARLAWATSLRYSITPNCKLSMASCVYWKRF